MASSGEDAQAKAAADILATGTDEDLLLNLSAGIGNMDISVEALTSSSSSSSSSSSAGPGLATEAQNVGGGDCGAGFVNNSAQEQSVTKRVIE